MSASKIKAACMGFSNWRDNKLGSSLAVTLSATVDSSSFLMAHRSAMEHHVCADGWQEH